MKSALHVVSKRRPRDLKLIRRAVRLFRNELAPRHIRRANARKWLAAVEKLGDRWVYAKTIKLERKAT